MTKINKTVINNKVDIKEKAEGNSNLNSSMEDIEPYQNMAYINFNGLNISIELMESQKYKNVEVIPIKTDSFSKKDFLTLKKGHEMGLVEIKELESSTVNTVICTNNAVVPLLLIDGDEITGAMQNRIINESMLIPANTKMNIPVSCTEQGRWEYKNHGRSFEPSLYSLNYSTRSSKSRAAYESRGYQSEVWGSISNLEDRCEFKSKTSSLNDNYENLKSNQDDYLKEFTIEKGQNGVIFIVNNELKGIELFYNHSIYKEYHEKIFRSYIIEAIIDNANDDNDDFDDDYLKREIHMILDNISNSEFKVNRSLGLGDNVKFSNDYGSGSSLLYDDELIHMNYFKDNDDIEIII